MKNLFKIVLPAFALMLAITASLAFTATENNAEEDVLMTGHYFASTLNQCQEIVVDCSTTITEWYCTVEISSVIKQVKDKNTLGTDCPVLLYQPEERTHDVDAIPNLNFPNP